MKKLFAYFISTVIFNTAIAGVLTIMDPEFSFWHEFIYSQCIGLSILFINLLVVSCTASGKRRVWMLAVALPVSVAIGVSLAFWASGVGSWDDPRAWQPVAVGLFFGFIGAVTLLLSERIEMEVEQRKLIKSESERREVEANLKLLQAQIEPHFLFNTLANVSSLIDSDPALAKKLLERLNDWLRVALLRARSDRSTLGDELDMLENYLQILKIRFGERLRWKVQVTETARRSIFPPMLLQPLVENAVRHGIEPKIGGGEIVIAARVEDGRLYCEVSDDGVGLQQMEGGGAGLSNVRERLATLSGGKGRLALSDKQHGGTVVTLEMPL
jgi:sensor histidine kinase YesM